MESRQKRRIGEEQREEWEKERKKERKKERGVSQTVDYFKRLPSVGERNAFLANKLSRGKWWNFALFRESSLATHTHARTHTHTHTHTLVQRMLK